MSDPTSQPIYPPSRPMARPTVAATPLQRSNYGIPPRQATTAAAFAPTQPVNRPPQVANSGPRTMDIRPPQPAPAVTATPQPTPTVQPAIVLPPAAQPQPQPQPIFAASRQAAAAPDRPHRKKLGKLASNAKLTLVIVGGVLLVAGGARWITAGNISGYTVAVGAVTVNDGAKTTIQFTADDGQLHRFTRNQSSRNQIPGTAVQVAYQPGAADATVQQVSAVQAAHRVATMLISAGLTLALVGGALFGLAILKRRSHQTPVSQAVPVSA